MNIPDDLGGWGPPWLRELDERRAHHDAAAAILRRATRTRGARAQVAISLGVKPPSVARMLHLFRSAADATASLADDEHLWHYSTQRTKAIAEQLGITGPERERLLFHVDMSKQRTFAATRTVQQCASDGMAPDLVATVERVYGEAEHTASGGYQRTRDAVAAILATTHPAHDPETFVFLLLVLHQCLCVLDRNDGAYYVARLATEVSDAGAGEALAFFAVQSRCAQGVALHNMELDGDALAAFTAAEEVGRQRHVARGFSGPMVARGRLLSAAARPPRRHATEELDRWFRGGEPDAATPDPDRALVMAEEALARSLARTGRPRALRRAQAIMARLVASPPPGALHAVHLWKTAGAVAAAAGDRYAAQHHLRTAAALAETAGLERELHGLRAGPP